MKCFNHHQADALGICKNCNKGICQECLTELKNGIACTATCVEEVGWLNDLLSRSRLSPGKTSGAYYRNAFISGACGLLFLGCGFYEPGMKYFMIPMGSIFCIGAILSINTGNKYKRE
jgi:hypothetical protein